MTSAAKPKKETGEETGKETASATGLAGFLNDRSGRRRRAADTPESRRRAYIVGKIRERLNGFTEPLFIPITKNSDRSKILVKGRSARSRNGHIPTDTDRDRLAASYDDWHWLDNPTAPRARNVLAALRRMLDPTGLEPPPEQDTSEPEGEAGEKLRRVMDRVNQLLGNTGIEIQITDGSRRPIYKWHDDNWQQQNQGWLASAQGTKFIVMFPGLDPTKMYGRDAENFLRDIGIANVVDPAFKAAAEEYPGLTLVVALDNGI